jgi:hypothetical protein
MTYAPTHKKKPFDRTHRCRMGAASFPAKGLPRGSRRSSEPNGAWGTASLGMLEGPQAGAVVREGGCSRRSPITSSPIATATTDALGGNRPRKEPHVATVRRLEAHVSRRSSGAVRG